MWLLHREGLGGLIADEMGLGKTFQVIAFLSTLLASGILTRSVPLSDVSSSSLQAKEVPQTNYKAEQNLGEIQVKKDLLANISSPSPRETEGNNIPDSVFPTPTSAASEELDGVTEEMSTGPGELSGERVRSDLENTDVVPGETERLAPWIDSLWEASLTPILIVCPATLLTQWREEMNAFFPLFRVVILHDQKALALSNASKGNKLLADIRHRGGIFISSYEFVRIHLVSGTHVFSYLANALPAESVHSN